MPCDHDYPFVQCYTALIGPAGDVDPSEAIREPDLTADSLPVNKFKGWALHRRVWFPFSGPESMLLNGKQEARSDRQDSTLAGDISYTSEMAALNQTRGIFQIPAEIRSDRFGVQDPAEAAYVRLMLVFLDGTSYDLSRVPRTWFESFDVLRWTTGVDDSVPVMHSICLYGCLCASAGWSRPGL